MDDIETSSDNLSSSDAPAGGSVDAPTDDARPGDSTTGDATDVTEQESSLPDWATLSTRPEAGDDAEEIVEIVEIVEPAGSLELASAELLEVVEEGLDGELEGDADAEPPEPSPYDRPGDWFVVHTYAGYENKVKQNLASRVKSMNVEEQIYEVAIPMEDVIEFKGGRKVVVQKKVFPGYLLVRMALDDDSWYVVRNTPGVTAFVGNASRPTPLSRKEVESILGVGKEEPGQERKVRPRLEFEVGEQVRVVTGPFADFNGAISDIDVARSKLTVLVNIFGRETPVELELGQVAKL
ncbi:MAG: transcription termination/antitermination protein NusG [Acidimicrobiia bacterium]